MDKNIIVIENEYTKLTLGADGTAKSLINKANGEECLLNDHTPMFTVTQDRPYNNEIKLDYPNKRTTFYANNVRREGDELIIGFEITPYEAVVKVDVKDHYIVFTLSRFIVDEEDYAGILISEAPASEFRIVNLALKERTNFGGWLNVLWDDSTAVNLMATSAHTKIDSQKVYGGRIFSADAIRGIKLKGSGVAIIACAKDELLNCIDEIEEDFNLPKGVKSRRNPITDQSILFTGELTPKTVDKHIEYAKRAGFKLMQIYYSVMFKAKEGWSLCGDYDYNENYPNGAEDLKIVLKKLNDAGIIPGLHFLHSYAGINSRYVTPHADHRLLLSNIFTLAKPLSMTDTEVYVEQNPEGMVMDEKRRVLKFDTELISYEGYTTEPPYKFTGCQRGYLNTEIFEHKLGIIGGILAVSEFGASSVYVDQNTSIQDEIAEKLAAVYNLGFKFVYFDGSEGVNPPFEYYVPSAQYKLYERFETPPIFCEGAAKSHFSWHMLSAGNAFDEFPMNVFKEKIAQFPASETTRAEKDFTKLNFGWWTYNSETMPDIYEYGTSRAAAWDCPTSMVMNNPDKYEENPRVNDVLEVLRRWEDVRNTKWLNEEQKASLKDLKQEHTLLINEKGEYELVKYNQIECYNKNVTAFEFTRNNKNYVVFWAVTKEEDIELEICPNKVKLFNDFGKDLIKIDGKTLKLKVTNKCYLESELSTQELKDAFKKA